MYDVTDFLERHPGTEEVMLEYLGYDATMAFRAVGEGITDLFKNILHTHHLGHSRGAMKMLEKYQIGVLPASERLNFTHWTESTV